MCLAMLRFDGITFRYPISRGDFGEVQRTAGRGKG